MLFSRRLLSVQDRVRQSLVWVACAVWAMLVWVLLMAEPGAGPPPPDWVVMLAEHGGDKVVHAGLFFVQSILLAQAVGRTLDGVRQQHDRPAAGSSIRSAVAAALVTAVYGICTELAQAAGSSRTGDWRDAAADALGALLGAALWWRWRRRTEQSSGLDHS